MLLPLSRRDLLEHLAALTGAALLPLPLGGCRSGCSRSVSSSSAKTFDRREWQIVEAATSRLVPSDDGTPGAREANVVGFIDAQLAEPHFAVFRQEFGPGLLALDSLAASLGSRFLALSLLHQDEVLRRLEAGEGSAGALDAAHFFQVLFTLTLEGLLADPAYGGNRNQVGWKLIGYAPRLPRHH